MIWGSLLKGASQVALVAKNPPANAGDAVRALAQEDPLEEGLAAQSSILTWRIPWTEEPGRQEQLPGAPRAGRGR